MPVSTWEVHLPSMCLKCKALVENYRKDQSIPTIIPTTWQAYTPNSAESDGKFIAKIMKGEDRKTESRQAVRKLH